MPGQPAPPTPITASEEAFRTTVLQRLTTIEELLRTLKGAQQEEVGDMARLGH